MKKKKYIYIYVLTSNILKNYLGNRIDLVIMFNQVLHNVCAVVVQSNLLSFGTTWHYKDSSVFFSKLCCL